MILWHQQLKEVDGDVKEQNFCVIEVELVQIQIRVL